MDAFESEETRALLEEARGGNARAFESLFEQYRSYLRRIVEARLDPRLKSRVDASDVLQETYLEAFRRLEGYVACPSASGFGRLPMTGLSRRGGNIPPSAAARARSRPGPMTPPRCWSSGCSTGQRRATR